ncbi:GGDEF domain-containing protein [Paraglaciecola sp. 2405UD69-4]|uniref:GGDEF domain-containing protein n=1 Tax=Paraglaciecola sp. 2405UD69-4 TaxID=3391836 RepID=UPI0039C8FD8B
MIAFTKITLLKGIKALAFVITIALLIGYEALPKRTLDIHPKLTSYIYESVDSEIGGGSELTWIDKDNYSWECNLAEGTSYPYCGISVIWSEKAPYEQIDLSIYDEIKIDLDYIGDATYLRVYLRNYYPTTDNKNIIGKAKFNSMSKVIDDFNVVTSIPFNSLTVADWWINNNRIPPDGVTVDVSKVIGIGVDIPYPSPLGPHQFSLNSITASGHYFSKNTLYLSIIIFWTTLLFLESIIRQTKLLTEVKLSGEQLKELRAKNEIYQKKAEHDRLTDILNREGLNRIIEDLYASKTLESYSLLVLDLDYFKTINDKHGHATGDLVLREVANTLKTFIRSYDIAARWGGEEFIILFHCVSNENILPFAEKLRKRIESTSFEEVTVNKITMSIGATNIMRNELFENAFIRADKALYKAKETGRNKTVVYL